MIRRLPPRCILAILVFVLGGLATPGWSRPLNVIFIVVDDLRTELSAYAAEARTPHLDRLAAKGVQFNNAYCQYPVCNASRSSFLTGLRPDETGIFSNQTSLRLKWPDVVTLPQAFRQAGYFTAGLGKLLHAGLDDAGRRTLFQDNASFDHFYNARDYLPVGKSQGVGRRLGDGSMGWARWQAAEGGDEALADGLLAAEAVRLLEEHQGRPFFLGIGFHKPHDPFVAPKAYFDLYPESEIEVRSDPADRTPLLEYALPDAAGFAAFTDRDRREFKRAYLACTSFTDAQVGKVLAAMDRLGLWGNTMVVLLGDHGYHLGEHNWWNKVTLFDIGARVPLIIWMPGSEGAGQSTEAVVELLDLYPTLLDYAGIAAPHELRGKSLRPVLADPAVDWQEPAFSQVRRSGVGMGFSVRQGDWRLTQWGTQGEGGHELHRATGDRAGFYNLYGQPEYKNLSGRMQELLVRNFPQIRLEKP